MKEFRKATKEVEKAKSERKKKRGGHSTPSSDSGSSDSGNGPSDIAREAAKGEDTTANVGGIASSDVTSVPMSLVQQALRSRMLAQKASANVKLGRRK